MKELNMDTRDVLPSQLIKLKELLIFKIFQDKTCRLYIYISLVFFLISQTTQFSLFSQESVKTLQYKSIIIIELLNNYSIPKHAAVRTQVCIALNTSFYVHFIPFVDKSGCVSLRVYGLYHV